MRAAGAVLVACCLCTAFANIWDNIFGNAEAPQIAFPNDFSVKFAIREGTQRDYLFAVKLDLATTLRAVRAQPFRKVFSVEMILATLVYSSAQQDLYINSLAKSCQIVRPPSLALASVMQAESNLDLTSLWRFVAFYEGQTQLEDGLTYHKFDISTLFTLMESQQTVDAHAYFDRENRLKRLTFDLPEQKRQYTILVLEDLTERTYHQSDFEIPQKWHCSISNQTLDYSDYTPQQVIEEVRATAKQYGYNG